MTVAISVVGPAHAGVVAALHRATVGAVESEASWSVASVGKLLGQPGAFAQIAEADADEAGPNGPTDGRPVGFALWVPVGEGLDLAAIGVDPGWRRRGIARRLVATAIAHARAAGVMALTLEVAEDNRPARSLYRAAGFAELSRRRGYYRRAGGGMDAGRDGVCDGACDAIVMRLDLGAGPGHEKAGYSAGET